MSLKDGGMPYAGNTVLKKPDPNCPSSPQCDAPGDEDVETPDDGEVEVAESGLPRAVRVLDGVGGRARQAEPLRHRMGPGEGPAGRVHR